MHQQLLARSASGHPIYVYSSWPLEQKSSEPAVIFIGGVHGDEPEGVVLAQKTHTWLKTSPPASLKPWVLIECLNEDGYRAGARTNSRGVDLNRNFPSKDWSPEQKSPRYHPGPSAGSEPEVQGLVHLLKSTPASLIVHAHSWDPCLVLTGSPVPPELEKFSSLCGYELISDIGYPTPGSLGSFGWQSLKTPVLCIEEQEGSEPEATWERFAPAIPWLFWSQEEMKKRGLSV